MKKWTKEEIEYLILSIDNKIPYSEIAKYLERTLSSIKHKASRLNLKSKLYAVKTTEWYKDKLPNNIILLEEYKTIHILVQHKCAICKHIWSATPNSIINGSGCPICNKGGKPKKTHNQYVLELPKDITVLKPYINAKTKILHRHTCGYEWKISPNNLLRGNSCPVCATSGFNPKLPAQVYLVEFKDNLYKIGLSNNYKKRIKSFGMPCNLIMVRKFCNSTDAIDKEKEWLIVLKPFMFNTGLLKSGNTETFIF